MFHSTLILTQNCHREKTLMAVISVFFVCPKLMHFLFEPRMVIS